MGCINWSESSTKIHNLIRGTSGWPGAYTFLHDNTLIKIIQSIPSNTKEVLLDDQPGTIRINTEQQLFVNTGQGEIELLQVQPATKKVMSSKDFVNGYKIKTGECFTSIKLITGK